MISRYAQLKERVHAANMELPRQGIVIYTFGNVSAIDREAGVMAIKPSGVPYDELRIEDIVVVDLQGQVVEGELRPSSDSKTHLVLYQAFPAVGGIAHTHSTYAVAWAQAARPIPLLGTTHADSLHLDVPCTEFMQPEAIAGDYETETGQQITACFSAISPAEIEMVLVAGHGPFTWGATPEKAVQNSVILEELARMACITLQINPEAPRLPQALIDKHYQRKHGPGAYYGQSGKK
jgi:L-ribulose-5-phosphate 4-epimerase